MSRSNKQLLEEIMESAVNDEVVGLHFSGPRKHGVYQDEGRWVAFDNRDGDCEVEEFRTRAKAVAWLDYEEDE